MFDTIHHHHRNKDAPENEARLRCVDDKLDLIIKKLEAIMPTLDDILTDVTDESGRLDSISTLITGLKQQLADALAGTSLSPATQAKVDAIFAAAESNKGKIDAALNANAPPPAPAP